MKLNEKQKHILDVAQKIIGEKGYNATSIRDIASKANVNVSMISYYFGGKEGLLKAMVESKLEMMKIRLENLVSDKTISPTTKIEILIKESIAKYWQNRALNNIILREHNFKINKELKALIYQIKTNRFEQLKKIVKEGQDLNHFKKEVNVPLLHANLTGMLKHIHFSDDYYFKLLEIDQAPNRETLLLEELENYLKNVFKLALNETNQ